MKFELYFNNSLICSVSENYGCGWSEWKGNNGVCLTSDTPEGWAAHAIRLAGGDIQEAVRKNEEKIKMEEELDNQGMSDKEQLDFLKEVSKKFSLFF